MNKKHEFDYAISYAGPDAPFVEEVVTAMKARGLRVFYAPDEQADIIGRNLIDYLHDVYLTKAQYCLVFISKHYAERKYPNRVERPAAQARALDEEKRYIIPVRLDDTQLQGMPSTTADIRNATPKQIADMTVAILLRDEAPVAVSPGGGARDHLVLRVLSFTELDVNLLKSTFKPFAGWSKSNTHLIPVELRLPSFFIEALTAYEAIIKTDEFKKHDSETQKAFCSFIRLIRKDLFNDLLRVPGWVLTSSQPVGSASLTLTDAAVELIRGFVLAKFIAAARCLVSYQLKGFSGPPWAAQFADCKPLWTPRVMGGLVWLCRTEGTERHLWLDADIFGWGGGTSFPRVRIYLPSSMVIRNLRPKATADDLLRYVCPQLLERELQGEMPILLDAAFRYPERMEVSHRNENVVEAYHFNEANLHNFNWKQALPAIEGLRDEILKKHESGGLTTLEALQTMYAAESSLEHKEVFAGAIKDLHAALGLKQDLPPGTT